MVGGASHKGDCTDILKHSGQFESTLSHIVNVNITCNLTAGNQSYYHTKFAKLWMYDFWFYDSKFVYSKLMVAAQ